jgi:hypothetical protein
VLRCLPRRIRGRAPTARHSMWYAPKNNPVVGRSSVRPTSGHIICSSCTDKIINEAWRSGGTEGPCPFCRAKFSRDQLRQMRVDFHDGNDAGKSESSGPCPSASSVEPLPHPVETLHNATCDSCQQTIVGHRYVRNAVPVREQSS